MKSALLFIALIVGCFLVDIHTAYSEPFNAADLRAVQARLQTKELTGTFVFEWQGYAPLTEYESKWLDMAVFDRATGQRISFQFWVHTWVGVCAPPCEITAEIILQNVDWVTE